MPIMRILVLANRLRPAHRIGIELHGRALPNRGHKVQIGAGGRRSLSGCNEGRTQKCKRSTSKAETHDALSCCSKKSDERLTHRRWVVQTHGSRDRSDPPGRGALVGFSRAPLRFPWASFAAPSGNIPRLESRSPPHGRRPVRGDPGRWGTQMEGLLALVVSHPRDRKKSRGWGTDS